MQITNIRDRANGLKVNYTQGANRGSITSDEVPSQAFVEALDALKPIVLDILELDEDYGHRLKVRGITITAKGEDNAVVTIVAMKEFQEGSPFNIATPIRYLHTGAEKEGGTSLALCEDHRKRVLKLCREAELYVTTNKAQRQLYLAFQIDEAADVTPAEEEPAIDVEAEVEGEGDEPNDPAIVQGNFGARQKRSRSRKSTTAAAAAK